MTHKEIFAGDQTFVNGSRRDEWEKIKWLSCEALIYLNIIPHNELVQSEN